MTFSLNNALAIFSKIVVKGFKEYVCVCIHMYMYTHTHTHTHTHDDVNLFRQLENILITPQLHSIPSNHVRTVPTNTTFPEYK